MQHCRARLQRRRGLDVEATHVKERQHSKDVIARGEIAYARSSPFHRASACHRTLGRPVVPEVDQEGGLVTSACGLRAPVPAESSASNYRLRHHRRKGSDISCALRSGGYGGKSVLHNERLR
jgi:hypothetical protein